MLTMEAVHHCYLLGVKKKGLEQLRGFTVTDGLLFCTGIGPHQEFNTNGKR
jgi:hypothetical protein